MRKIGRSQKDAKIKKKMISRSKVIFIGIFIVAFLILFGRLTDLQVVNSTFYAERAQQQQLSEQILPAQRGSIYDRNMTPLAESSLAWNVIISPSYIVSDKQRNLIADSLSKILSMDRDTLYKEINNKSSYMILAKQVDKTKVDAITKFTTKNNIGCISTVQNSKRYYPFGSFASQLIGFTGTNGQGLTGVEAQYNTVLTGTPGKSVAERTATGKEMPYNVGEEVEAENGDNLVLTVDEKVQQSLESNLKKALIDNNVSNRVAGIVMNVNNGEVVAMATEPEFNLNDPYTIADSTVKGQLASLSGDDLKKATTEAQQTQWKNKATSEPYEPGSTFKIITASAAMDLGLIHENDEFSDPGSITVQGTTFHDWNAGYGSLNFIKAFEESDNVVFIKVGLRLGIDNFYQYLSGYGLTQKTGVDLPGEADGVSIPKEKYGQVELASSAFGQSNKFTAIQLLTAVSAASNGGYLVQPHVVREVTDTNGNVVKTYNTSVKRQVISTETSKEMDKILELEVSEGSGKNAYVAGYRIGGKTGTAQKLDSSDPTARISEFAGIAPSNAPQYAVIFMMDEPRNSASNYGGVIASPVVGNIFSEILPYLGVEPQYTEEEQAKLAVKAPNVVGKSVSEAESGLKESGFTVNVVGSGQTVTSQTPDASNAIPHNGTVILYTDGSQAQNTVTVPSVIGMTPEAASQAIKAVGLNIDSSGVDLTDGGEAAYEQDKAANSQVAPGTVVTVKFRNNNISVQ